MSEDTKDRAVFCVSDAAWLRMFVLSRQHLLPPGEALSTGCIWRPVLPPPFPSSDFCLFTSSASAKPGKDLSTVARAALGCTPYPAVLHVWDQRGYNLQSSKMTPPEASQSPLLQMYLPCTLASPTWVWLTWEEPSVSTACLLHPAQPARSPGGESSSGSPEGERERATLPPWPSGH